MSDRKQITPDMQVRALPNYYTAAWREAHFDNLVQQLIARSGLQTWEAFGKQIAALVDDARQTDASLKPFKPAIAQRWVVEGTLKEGDSVYLPYIQKALGIADGSDDATQLYQRFNLKGKEAPQKDEAESPRSATASAVSPTDKMTAFCRHVGQQATCKKGFVADALPLIMKTLELDTQKLALKTGIYPSFIEAYKEGQIVPQGEALKALESVIDPQRSNRGMLNAAFERLVERDNQRMAGLWHDNPNRLKVVQALGGVTKEMHLHDLMDAILVKGPGKAPGMRYADIEDAEHRTDVTTLKSTYYFSGTCRNKERYNFARTERSREIVSGFAAGVARAIGDDTGVYKQLIRDFALDAQARLPFKDVFDKYLASEKSPTILGLFEYAEQEWGCALKEVGKALGLGGSRFTALDVTELAPFTLSDIAARQNFSLKQTDDLVSIRKGTFNNGNVESLTADAQTILNDPAPTYEAYKDNLIVKQMKADMPSQANLQGADAIEKTLVPNALFSCLVNRNPKSIRGVLRVIGKSEQLAGVITRGEQELFAIHRQNSATEYQADKALEAAQYFTQDPKLADNLALAFLEIGKRRTADELMQEVEAKKIPIGQMVQTCRLQLFKTRTQIASQLSPSGRYHSEVILELETKNAPVSKDYANKLAEIYYKNEATATSKSKFIDAVQGKRIDAEAVAQVEQERGALLASIEERIEKGCENYGKPGAPIFSDILPDIKKLCSQSISEFHAKLAKYCHHVGSNAYRQWLEPTRAVGEEKQASAIASLLIANGMREELKEKLVQLAQKSVPVYDPAPLDALSVNSTQKERVSCIRQMRYNMGRLTPTEMASKLGITMSAYCKRFEASDYSASAATNSQAVAEILIPTSAENYEQQRNKFATIINTPPPEVAASVEVPAAGLTETLAGTPRDGEVTDAESKKITKSRTASPNPLGA